MSDDDMNDQPDMGMGGMGGDDFSDGDDDYAPPGASLPEGITKEIITEANSDNWRKPKVGDQVQVHYVGTLESDGSEFDSSRSRNKPFEFTLGTGQVIKGWDLGVATMKKGELAKFTLKPEFAYGESGSPPKIPANATLLFEVELISWTSQDDLFNDGTVIKACITEGNGWKKPKDGDEVQLTFKALKDGTSKFDVDEKDYVIGSGVLEPFGNVVDKALTDMKKGEVAELKCTNEFVETLRAIDNAVPGDVETLSVTLHEVYEIADVSFAKDKSLMKKQVKEGDGYDKPKEASQVTLQVLSAVDQDGANLPGFLCQAPLSFTCGDGSVCDALEFAVSEMKKGEKAIVTCMDVKKCSEAKLGLAEVKALSVAFTLQLDDFEKAKDTWSMSEDEKLKHGEERKAAAGNLFKNQRFELALKSYKGVIDLFNYIDNFKEESKTAAKTLKTTCELNKAACLLKTGDWVGTKTACNAVLKEESSNIKALFRRANALKELGEYDEAMKDCKTILEKDKANPDARRLIPKLKELQKVEDNKSKNMFANMCKGLGKLNTPEPYKDNKVLPDDDDDDDDEEDGDVPMGDADKPADKPADNADVPMDKPVVPMDKPVENSDAPQTVE